MLQRGTLLTKTDIIAVFPILPAGSTVNLPLFNTSFSISGVFDSPLDNFDPIGEPLRTDDKYPCALTVSTHRY
jgi:hypothetical protein